MLVSYLLATGLTFAVLVGWIMVQRAARRFAGRYPEYGPQRECLGCGLSCVCSPVEQDQQTNE